MDCRLMAGLAADLVEQYRQRPDVTPESVKGLPGYLPLIEGAAKAGFTGPDLDGQDEHFTGRRPEWFAQANVEQLQVWLHTVLRAERWNSDWPTAVIGALESGQMQALASRLDEIAADAHA